MYSLEYKKLYIVKEPLEEMSEQKYGKYDKRMWRISGYGEAENDETN